MSEPATVVMVSGSASGMLNTVMAGPHTLFSDEPEAEGGTGKGPNPYELLLGALGSCKSMTVSLYARRKGWPLRNVDVRLSHQRVYKKDCEDCEDKNGMLDRVEVTLSLDGDLSTEQRARLMEISEHCPVHKTLMGDIQIVTKAG